MDREHRLDRGQAGLACVGAALNERAGKPESRI
jgi:hypothetical protein